MGSKKKPFYRIVVVDSRTKRDGKYIESVGTYNPVKVPMLINIDESKVSDWIGKGAQLSPTVKNLLQKLSFFEKRNLAAKGLDEEAVNQALAGKEKKLETSRKKKKTKEG